MKNSVIRSLAILFALMLIIIQFCACSCIEEDSAQNQDGDPANTQSQQADSSESPSSTDGPVQPDVTENIGVPSQSSSATPAPNATEAPFDSAAPSQATQPANTGSTNTGAPETTPAPSGSPQATTTPSSAPVGSEPAITPEPTPEPPVVTGLTWFDDSAAVYCDLDLDGKPERIKLDLISTSAYTYSCMLKITVGANGKELIDTFTTEYFTKALINDFNTGDKRVEIMICGGRGNRGQVTKAYRLNSDSSTINTISVPGWIETVSGNSIELGRYIDVIGTWACSANFAFSRSDFALVQSGSEWQVHRDSDRWCTVARDFLVELNVNGGNDNYAGFLYNGDRIYPTATNLSSYIKFVSDIGDNGTIAITSDSSGALMLNKEPIANWFRDLEFID